MKTLAAAVTLLLLAGCCHSSTGWDWYRPCDLIEGRAERDCRCAPSVCQKGEVVCRTWAVPAEGAAPAEATIVVEEVQEAPATEAPAN